MTIKILNQCNYADPNIASRIMIDFHAIYSSLQTELMHYQCNYKSDVTSLTENIEYWDYSSPDHLNPFLVTCLNHASCVCSLCSCYIRPNMTQSIGNCNKIRKTQLLFDLETIGVWWNHHLMAYIWEKAISILAGNLNSGFSYPITTVGKLLWSMYI